MRKIAVLNLKGGTAKTTTALNMAYELARRHGKRVLVCDMDPQANATKFFGVHDYDVAGMENVFRDQHVDIRTCIRATVTPDIDIVPSNLNLDDAATALMMDKSQEQNTRLRSVLADVEGEYDFCITDCPPGIGLNVINALCAAEDVIVPIKVDKHALDGMEELMEVVGEMHDYTPSLKTVRCLVTMFRKEPMVVAGCMALERSRYDCFQTKIRYSPKVVGSTFYQAFIAEYSCGCAAAVDYRRMVREYVDSLPGMGVV